MTPCTPEELAALVLPAHPDGLLRKCSPIVALDAEGKTDRRVEGVVLGLPPDGVTFAGCGVELTWIRWTVALDLNDATGRAHAAWYIRDHCGSPNLSHGMQEFACPVPMVGTRERVWRMLHLFCLYLEHLDPDDPRTLPDGSRWVDAECLRLVCLHVAANQPTPQSPRPAPAPRAARITLRRTRATTELAQLATTTRSLTMADHSSSNTADAIRKGWTIKGDPDTWELLAKGEYHADGVLVDYHSTKVLRLADGSCIIQSDSRVGGQFVRSQTWAPALPVGLAALNPPSEPTP